MFVSLIEDVKSLGPQGQIVEVPDGYAINFLFPQHLAVKVDKPPAEDNARGGGPMARPNPVAEAEQNLASEIDGLEVVIPVTVEGGKLKEPVTATEVRAALKELGHKVPKSVIKMKAIEQTGRTEVPLEFPSGFEATVSVSVEG